PARAIANGTGSACPPRVDKSGTGDGYLAGTRTRLAKGQASLATDHARRRVQHACASGSGAGRDVAAVARQRLRQGQTPTATTGDAQLPGSGSRKDGRFAVRGGSETGGGAARRIATTTRITPGKKPAGGGSAGSFVAVCGRPDQSR